MTVDSGGFEIAAQDAHLAQSIMMILMTRKGERLMRPWFGSDLWQYLDAPVNAKTLAAMRAAIYTAIRDNEDRARIKTIKITSPDNGHLRFDITIVIAHDIKTAVTLSYNRETARWEGQWQA